LKLFYLVKNLPTSTIAPRSPLLADADAASSFLTWEEGGSIGCHTEASSITAVLLLLLLLKLIFLFAGLEVCAATVVT
jgi:hypothetical protein